MKRHLLGRLTALLTVAGIAAALAVVPAASQQKRNQREVKATTSAIGKESNIWTLDFRFKDPRVIQVHVPGRGTRLCWYLWYQVINRTGKPRRFIPDFEIVTRDFPGVWHDEVLPSVQKEIARIEDPNNLYKIHNSVTIATEPIPPSKTQDAFPRAVTGVAIWDGSRKLPNGKDLADSLRFTIYVSGLSNGWLQVDGPAGAGGLPIIRRKTLQLNFKKNGDRYDIKSREIEFVPPAEWVYRASRLRLPVSAKNSP